ncbi:MAG: DUF4783 domain-containing protein [Bacteroidota bacterium]
MRTVVTIVLFLASHPAESQVLQRRNDVRNVVPDRSIPTERSQQALKTAVRDLETGLRSSSTAPFAPAFASSVQVALPGMGRGQYSANQAGQLIAGYLARHRVDSLVVERIESAVAAPYIFGSLVVSGGAGRDTLRLYVAFVMNDARWSISHFSLY